MLCDQNKNKFMGLSYMAQAQNVKLVFKSRYRNWKDIGWKKERWEKEKERIKQINHVQDELVKLEVSGVMERLKVRRARITFLGIFLREKAQWEDGKVFIDRDPDIFRLVITCLTGKFYFNNLKELNVIIFHKLILTMEDTGHQKLMNMR